MTFLIIYIDVLIVVMWVGLKWPEQTTRFVNSAPMKPVRVAWNGIKAAMRKVMPGA